jgi:hypothetical protein
MQPSTDLRSREADRDELAREALDAASQMRDATRRIRADAVDLLPDAQDDRVIDLR